MMISMNIINLQLINFSALKNYVMLYKYLLEKLSFIIYLWHIFSLCIIYTLFYQYDFYKLRKIMGHDNVLMPLVKLLNVLLIEVTTQK